MRFALMAAVLAGPVAADDAWLAFMGGQGCTYGVEARALGEAAGFEGSEMDAMAEAYLLNGQAERHDRWVVLNAEICTIRLPDITPVLSLDDADVAATIEVVAEDPEWDLRGGCYLDLRGQDLETSRGWSADDAERARWDLVAAGVISGEIRFFESSFLRTPVTFQVLRGDCAAVGTTAPVAENHRAVVEHFGPYMRRMMAYVPCDQSLSPERFDGQIASELQGMSIGDDVPPGDSFNAYLSMEYFFVALAAGWIEGASATERGTPRPPMCHYRE